MPHRALDQPQTVPEFTSFFKELGAIEQLSEQTLTAYSLDLSQAVVRAGRPPRGPGQEAELLKWARRAQQGWAEGGLKPATLNRKTATLKKWLGHLHRHGEIEKDLAAQLHCPRARPRLPRFLSVDELEALLEANLSNELHPTPLLLSVLAGCGLRISEACQLTWSALDFNRRELRIFGKGSRVRIVPVPQRTLDALYQQYTKMAKTSGSIWGVEGLHPRRAYSLVKEAGARAALTRPLNPHALRHTYATTLLRGGASLRALQELLGHRSLEATSRYTHVQLDDLARTLEAHSPLRKSRSSSIKRE